MRKFMIQLSFPGYFTPDFVQLIPKQRGQIVRLLAEGRIANFSLSMERSNAWMVMNAKSEEEAEDVLERFAMYEYFEYEIFELALHDTKNAGFPELVLN